MNLNPDMQLLNGLIGGLLIGFSALILLLGIGRIAGISGIAGRALTTREPGSSWRWLFLIGLLAGAALFAAVNGGLTIQVPTLDTRLLIAAVLVGAGTRLAMGCTSGHGVCGLGRRSPRSLLATVTFMATAIATVAIVGNLP